MTDKSGGGGSRGATSSKLSVDRDGLATSFVSPSPQFLAKWKKSIISRSLLSFDHPVADMQQEPPSAPFSLNDEARRTQGRHTSQIDHKLRFSQIAFISAGSSDRDDLKDCKDVGEPTAAEVSDQRFTTSATAPEGRMANLSLGGALNLPPKSRTSPVVGRNTKSPTITPKDQPLFMNGKNLFYVDPHGSQAQIQTQITTPEHNRRPGDLFFLDLHGSKDLVHTTLPEPTVGRSPSPTGSSSSEELILYAGRDSLRGKKRRPNRLNASLGNKSNPRIIDDPVTSSSDRRPAADHDLEPKHSASMLDNNKAMSSQPIGQPSPSTGEPKSTIAKPSQKPKQSRIKKKHQLDAALADYIDNMDNEAIDDVVKDAKLSARPLDIMDTSGWEDEPNESDGILPVDSITSFSETWDKADLQDFDGLSTSDEAHAEIKQIFAKRQRPSGLQYLVVYEGFSIDDARWIHIDSLNSAGAQKRVKVFETEQAILAHDYADSASFMDSDEETQIAKDVQNDMDDFMDEQDILDRNIERMTDEQIARLLSKQEQLGIGSDKLLLFDAMTKPSGARGRKRSQKRTSAHAPSASLLADVLDQDPYNAFDVLDMDRPSLKKKANGRRGTIPMAASDSELEQSQQAAWAHDREKKKKRKQEREEFRAQGLLGKKGKVDMKAKYSQGMGMNQVLEEVKGFLASTNEK